MNVYLGVEKFGKIDSARIKINKFTIFVGNNNSGKTYMMQLIYGVLNEIMQKQNFQIPYFPNLEDEYYLKADFFVELEKQINKYLEDRKEQIIKNIFHSSIPIAKLYIEFHDIDENYKVIFKEETFAIVKQDDSDNASRIIWSVITHGEERVAQFGYPRNSASSDKFSNGICEVIIKSLLGINQFYANHEPILYLPASRTGILLLYKYFFSKKNQADTDLIREDHGWITSKGNSYGLTEPVYDFLQFLLRYAPSEISAIRNEDLLEFIENHLIDGQLSQDNENTIYTPRGEKQGIPLYLSSSMVNELAPLVKVLSGNVAYDYLLYDEIETCLHPLKQREMARLLNRLYNDGMRLIVSTHSDTMAAQMNNLFLLSYLKISDDELEKKLDALKLTKDDLLRSFDVSVYQFANDENGISHVEELSFREVPYVGYEFPQFTNSALRIYDDSKKIVESER